MPWKRRVHCKKRTSREKISKEYLRGRSNKWVLPTPTTYQDLRSCKSRKLMLSFFGLCFLRFFWCVCCDTIPKYTVGGGRLAGMQIAGCTPSASCWEICSSIYLSMPSIPQLLQCFSHTSLADNQSTAAAQSFIASPVLAKAPLRCFRP